MNRPVRQSGFFIADLLVAALPAQAAQLRDVLHQQRIIDRDELEKPVEVLAAPGRYPVKHPFAIAKPAQKPRLAQQLELLGDPGLTLPEDFRQLRHAAFAVPAQRHQAQAGRVAERLEALQELFRVCLH